MIPSKDELEINEFIVAIEARGASMLSGKLGSKGVAGQTGEPSVSEMVVASVSV